MSDSPHITNKLCELIVLMKEQNNLLREFIKINQENNGGKTQILTEKKKKFDVMPLTDAIKNKQFNSSDSNTYIIED